MESKIEKETKNDVNGEKYNLEKTRRQSRNLIVCCLKFIIFHIGFWIFFYLQTGRKRNGRSKELRSNNLTLLNKQEDEVINKDISKTIGYIFISNLKN